MAKEGRGFYDTNVLVAYLFREEDRFGVAKEVLEKHVVKALSIISLHEIHMYSIRFGVEDKFIEVKESLHKLFRVEPLSQDVCVKASHLRKSYGVPEVDSLILATAVFLEYNYFYTFDDDFKELNNKVIEKTMVRYLA